jgi:hypothetical protein
MSAVANVERPHLSEWKVRSEVAPSTLGSPDFTRPRLRDRERHVVRSIAEAMLAGDVNAERLDTIVQEVDLYLGAASAFVRFGLRALLFVVRLTPILLFVAARTIDRLELDARIELCARLERMPFVPLSLAFVAWRTIIVLVAYDDAEELVRIGYVHKYTRHKRRLALLGSGPRTVVPPAESGVRLKDDDDRPSVPSMRSGAA